MKIERRKFLKGGVVATMATIVAGAGLLVPARVLAAWPKKAFRAKSTTDALQALLGISDATGSAEIRVNAPAIAENGATVPVNITTDMADIESLAIVVPNNRLPLAAFFIPGDGALGFVSTRIKMGKTGDVLVIVKSKGKLYSAIKKVKVTIGGCGGG